MLILSVGLILTTVLLTAIGRRAGLHASDKGSMSSNWLVAHQASRHSSQ